MPNKTLVLAALLVAIALPAHAADAIVAAVPASSESEVWFGNALKTILGACAIPIAAILTQMLWMVAKKMGVQASEADMQKLNKEAVAALTVGAMKASDLIAEKGWDHVAVNNAVLREGLTYFLQRFPDRAVKIAEQAGVQSPKEPSAAKEDAVAETLMARLPDAMNQASASPATPPVTTTTTVKPGPPVEVVTETQGAQPQPEKA